MNINKNDIISVFTSGKDYGIDDDTNWICQIICLIEFYDNDEIVAYTDNKSFKPLRICYLDDNNNIHVSKNITKCSIYLPKKECIDVYNNSNTSKGYKIRAIYFKDHIDKYNVVNLRSNIIKRFRRYNLCIDDRSGKIIDILALMELNDKESDLLIINDLNNPLLCTCYLDNDYNIHRTNYTYSILNSIKYISRKSILEYNLFTVHSRFKIKNIYFKDYTDNIM